MPAPSAAAPIEDHDRGLLFDLQTRQRQQALRIFGGAGLAGLAVLTGCVGASGSTATAASAASGSSSSSTTTTTCADGEIPDETAGPCPEDGSNGPDVLTESGIVRSDIRSGFGSSTTTADGVPLTITLTVPDTSAGCAALAGAAVYLWHCNIDGKHSMYDDEIVEDNYLRGVQETDANGRVSFTTIFPAAYSGRWSHAHFEVYASLPDATAAEYVNPIWLHHDGLKWTQEVRSRI